MDNKNTGAISRSKLIFVGIIACLIYGLNGGMRTNYGILLQGATSQLGIEYSAASFIAAVANLMFGVTQPIFGALALKKSNAFVLILGSAMSLAGMVMIPLCTSAAMLMLFWGILMPAGFGALSFGVIMGAITPVLGDKAAAIVSGLISASSGLIGVGLSPAMGGLLKTHGMWGAVAVPAIVTAALIPACLWFAKAGKDAGAAQVDPAEISISGTIRDAFSSGSYRLLCFAFFTCGYHMALVENHFYSNMIAAGIPEDRSAWILSVYGITAMLGCIITGALCSRFPHKIVGGLTFASRLLVIGLFLIMGETLPSFILFGALLGLTGNATVPPVNGLTNKLFGPVKLATLFGILMVFHQVGSFVSAWLGGICLSATGTYTLVWISSAVFATLAGLACFGVKEPKAES